MIKIHAFHILKFSSEIDINISDVVYRKTVYSSRPPSLSLSVSLLLPHCFPFMSLFSSFFPFPFFLSFSFFMLLFFSFSSPLFLPSPPLSLCFTSQLNESPFPKSSSYYLQFYILFLVLSYSTLKSPFQYTYLQSPNI